MGRVRSQVPNLSAEQSQVDERLDVEVVEALGRSLVEAGQDVPPDVIGRVIGVLLESTKLSCSSREMVAAASFRTLFALCSSAPPNISENRAESRSELQNFRKLLASETAPPVLQRCGQVISEFVHEDRQSGLCPVARWRLNELSLVLELLSRAEIDESVLPSTSKTNGRVGSLVSVGPFCQKRHLLVLFPLLCDLITTRQESIKGLLKGLLHSIAATLYLE
eukprot:TRINITY_DN1888_c0_g1_i2.p3 TRINITY_DN1888_c0_g1~~TRINITY_DN1888_c0_g1_i2.p3  ORF type:complete len:222 (-),score=52.23 TRINITY_DN1888_c0_g1_i2:1024-1689(-)